MNSFIIRHRGKPPLGSPCDFTINCNGIKISHEARIVKSYSTGKFKNYGLNESKDSIIANGKIVPVYLDYHKGAWIFKFPNDANEVLNILYRMFVNDKILERMHDNCGFIKHYSRYIVFINEKRSGIISEILN